MGRVSKRNKNYHTKFKSTIEKLFKKSDDDPKLHHWGPLFLLNFFF